MDSLLFYSIVLFLIINPVGNVSQLQKIMDGIEPKRRNHVIIRELLIALIFMLGINLIGEFLFNILELSKATLRLASGVILFLVAIKILFPKIGAGGSHHEEVMHGEPFIVPIAIPMVAGPSLLATILLFANLEPLFLVSIISIGVAWSGALFVFLISPYLQRFLGKNGLVALEKLMGMVLMLLAVQRLAEGIQQFYADHIR